MKRGATTGVRDIEAATQQELNGFECQQSVLGGVRKDCRVLELVQNVDGTPLQELSLLRCRCEPVE